MLRLDDRYLWDFWFARDGDDVHVFYLQAPRDLPSPDDRHANATIGHAVSRDLRSWEVLPDALGPGPAGAWDQSTTWTGSVVRDDDGTWWLFYTGTSRGEHHWEQAVGAATSTDLISWTKPFDAPLVTVDTALYEPLDEVGGGHEAWRDPWVVRDTATGRWHMLITARARTGPIDARGVVAHAWSDDLAHWEVGPPLVGPGEFAHMECPQLLEVDGRWQLVFSVYEWAHSASRRERTPAVRGTHHLVGATMLGPFTSPGDRFLSGPALDGGPDLYAGKLVEDPRGGWAFMGFVHDGPDGFGGVLADPVPVDVAADGTLQLQR